MNFRVDEDSCSSQITNEGSESILVVATIQSPFVPQTECCNAVTRKSVTVFRAVLPTCNYIS